MFAQYVQANKSKGTSAANSVEINMNRQASRNKSKDETDLTTSARFKDCGSARSHVEEHLISRTQRREKGVK